MVSLVFLNILSIILFLPVLIQTMDSRLCPAPAKDSFQVLKVTQENKALEPTPVRGNIVTRYALSLTWRL